MGRQIILPREREKFPQFPFWEKKPAVEQPRIQPSLPIQEIPRRSDPPPQREKRGVDITQVF